MKQLVRLLCLALLTFDACAAYSQETARFVTPGAKLEALPPIADWDPESGVLKKLDLPGARDAAEMSGGPSGYSVVSPPVPCEPNKLYRFRVKACYVDGQGSSYSPCGAPFFLYDFDGFPQGEVPTENFGGVVFIPSERGNVKAQLSRWNSQRRFRFADPTFVAVQPVFALAPCANSERGEVLPLGAGESLDENGVYRFKNFTAKEITDYDRPLEYVNATYKPDRWAFLHGSSLVYRFALEPVKLEYDAASSEENGLVEGKTSAPAPIPFVSGALSVELGYCTNTQFTIDASADGKEWTAFQTYTGDAIAAFSLDPIFAGKALDEVYIRFRNVLGTAQILGVNVELQTRQEDERRFVGEGRTLFADLDADVEVGADAPNATPWGVDPNTENLFAYTPDGAFLKIPFGSELCPAKARKSAQAEEYDVKFARPATLGVPSSAYFVQDYAHAIEGAANSSGASVSWALSDYRVPRDPKRVEIQEASPIVVKTPKNGYESFQVVVRPTEGDLRGLTCGVSGKLVGPRGASISADEVELFYEYYHFVSNPTDSTSDVGWYPDALVPVADGSDGKGAPLTAEKGRNFTFYATVRAPRDAKPGAYRGKLELTANEGAWSAEIPFAVEVWDFALPEKNTILTAYGGGDGLPWEYFNAQSESDRHAVWEKYLELTNKYRVNPFDVFPIDVYDVKWLPDANPPRCEIDFTNYDRAIKRVLNKYKFTRFRIDLECGTSIEGYGFDTPEYQAMAKDYLTKLYAYLKKNDLLDVAFGVMFDEPNESAYEIIAKTFGMVRKYMPDFKLLITEEPNDALIELLDRYGGKVEYWCPLASNYSSERAAERRKLGEESWIYVCTGPKAPYCTEFIDKPGVEERIRFWQMFERGIVGDLMWSTTFWNSSAAYPNGEQNPYEDPMAYVPGPAGATPVKKPWGNGDGRFCYPPLERFSTENDGKPILKSPNPCLRLDSVREGIQDYETCAILKRLSDENELSAGLTQKIEALLDFDAITTDLTHFTLDPKVVLARRDAIARAILEAQAELKAKR